MSINNFSDQNCDLNERFSGRKSNFAQTCNLLSQFLKEKRTSGDLSVGIPPSTRPPVTTTNLLTNMKDSSSNLNSVDFVRQFVGSYNSTDFRKPATTEPEPEPAQMTIFYKGEVLVFDDFPADKAKEIITLASNSNTIGSVSDKRSVEKNKSRCTSVVVPESKIVTQIPAENPTQELVEHRPQANASDLPIARRASLHRFFEKRKDRAAARAPYQVNPPAAASSKPGGSNSEKEGEVHQSCSKHLDLNLLIRIHQQQSSLDD